MSMPWTASCAAAACVAGRRLCNQQPSADTGNRAVYFARRYLPVLVGTWATAFTASLVRCFQLTLVHFLHLFFQRLRAAMCRAGGAAACAPRAAAATAENKSLRLSVLTTVGVSLKCAPFASIPLYRRWACRPPPPPSGCELPHSAYGLESVQPRGGRADATLSREPAIHSGSGSSRPWHAAGLVCGRSLRATGQPRELPMPGWWGHFGWAGTDALAVT